MTGGGPTRVAIAAARLPREGEARAVEVSPALRLLVARVDGRLYALDDACNHAGCPLSEGRIEGPRVVCPCHGMAFDLRDGRLLSVPRLAEDQAAYPVVEQDGGAVVLLDRRD